MVNKKGWLRIVEALVSILIIFGAVLTVATTHRPASDQDFCASLPPLLEEVAQDTTLRNAILDGKKKPIEDFFKAHILNPAIISEVKICDPSAVCARDENSFANVEVCAEERIVAKTTESSQVVIKKLKVFLYRLQ